MAFPIQYPQINGHRFSFNSCEFRFNGIIYVGVKSLNYKMALKGGIVRGTGPNPIGRTVGEAEYTGDCEMLRLEFDALILTLGAPVVGFGEAVFSIMATQFEIGSPVVVDEIIGARIEEPEVSHQQGTDGTTVKFTFSAMRMRHNGAEITTRRAFNI